MSQYQTVYLGLGANLNDPIDQIHHAIAALKALPDTNSEVKVSTLYSSKPMGPQISLTMLMPLLVFIQGCNL